MPLAIGIKLTNDSPARFFRMPEFPVAENDFCVVPGEEPLVERTGFVAGFEGRCPCQQNTLAPLVRSATDEEVERWYELQHRRKQAIRMARTKIEEHGLPMKLSSVRFNDDQNLVIFNFTADHRIDFRELVRDLAGLFKARIELWQIGMRHETMRVDGFGQCGQRLCCSGWMKEFPAVSIRLAREQDLFHAPIKLSGLCSRLRCCLRFEHETYCEICKTAPALGGRVRIADRGEGEVTDRNLIRGLAQVKLDDGSKPEWFTFDQMTVLGGGRPDAAKARMKELGEESTEETIPEDV